MATKLAAQTHQFARAGAAMGAALANNLTSALEQLAGGGEKDVGKIIANILAGLLTAGGGIIGNLLLPGIGGAVGSALGGLCGRRRSSRLEVPGRRWCQHVRRPQRMEFFRADSGRQALRQREAHRAQAGVRGDT